MGRLPPAFPQFCPEFRLNVFNCNSSIQ